MIRPTDLPRRSFVYRKLIAAGAVFGATHEAAVALDFGDPGGEAAALAELALADLSPLPRGGFKGPGTVEWLAAQGLRLPLQNNLALRQAGGAWVLRLGPGEILILDDPTGGESLTARLEEAWQAAAAPAPRGWPLPRRDSHAWFLVAGREAPAMLAKLCGVDLRPPRFPEGRVAQTTLAQLTAIVLRTERAPAPSYHLLADSASAGYLWDCLVDAMAEFGGRPVGLTALRHGIGH